MKILVDMNLSPEWIAAFAKFSWTAVHWSTIGPPNADDTILMAWARDNGHIVLTHDLDFGATLALTHASGPSVVQIRGQDVLPEDIGSTVIAAIRQFEADLDSGALVVVEPRKLRVRLLPL